MDRHHLRQAHLAAALDGAHPEADVRTRRVLHQHRQAGTPQGFGELLHHKGIGRGAGTDPDGLEAVFQHQLHVFGAGHLAGERQRLALCGQRLGFRRYPLQRRLA